MRRREGERKRKLRTLTFKNCDLVDEKRSNSISRIVSAGNRRHCYSCLNCFNNNRQLSHDTVSAPVFTDQLIYSMSPIPVIALSQLLLLVARRTLNLICTVRLIFRVLCVSQTSIVHGTRERLGWSEYSEKAKLSSI